MTRESADVSVYFSAGLEVRDVVFITHRAFQEFPCRILPEFTPWYPSTSDTIRPIRPKIRPPLITPENLKNITRSEFSPSDIIRPEISPSNIIRPEISPSDIIRPEISPSDIIRPEISPSLITTDIVRPEISPSDIIRSEISPSDIIRPTSKSEDWSSCEKPREFKRSWCVMTDRTTPLKITNSFSRVFVKIIEKHRLHLHQRVKWMVCELNCVTHTIDEVWFQLNRAIRHSRLPTCNANFQRHLSQIWIYCDLFYSEFIGNFLKKELQLSGHITLTVHKLGDILQF